MSLALDFLKEYLNRPDQTQTDFAMSAGMTPTNVSDLLKGDVAISDRNLTKLIRGLRNEKDRHDFLTAYLRDRVPSDYAEIITVHLKAPIPSDRLMESGDEESLDHQIIQAFASLPSDLYRKRVIRFLAHLKKDAGLRDLFTRTVAYLEEDDLGSPLSLEEPSSTYSAEKIVAAEQASRRGAKPAAGGTAPAARASSKRKRAGAR